MRKTTFRIFAALSLVLILIVSSATTVSAAKPFLKVDGVTANSGTYPYGSWDVTASWSYKNVAYIQVLIKSTQGETTFTSTQGFCAPFPLDDIYSVENADYSHAVGTGSETVEVVLFSKTSRIIEFISQLIVYQIP